MGEEHPISLSTGLNFEGDALQHFDIPVRGMKIVDPKHHPE
jgi:hypothetical protein